jgi:hypothetical protein
MDAKKELEDLGFIRVGTIRPTNLGDSCSAEFEREVTGSVVYAHVVGNVIRKFGITTSPLRARVQQNVSTINGVIALKEGRPVRDAGWHHRSFDSFKRLAPEVIMRNEEIELWAQECASAESMRARETELNSRYRPEWTKEGNSRAGLRRGTSDVNTT